VCTDGFYGTGGMQCGMSVDISSFPSPSQPTITTTLYCTLDGLHDGSPTGPRLGPTGTIVHVPYACGFWLENSIHTNGDWCR
jgi:hypothetical protein